MFKKFLLIVILASSTSAFAANKCEEIRAVIKIGSEEQSLVVGKINSCLNKPIEIIKETKISLPLAQNNVIENDAQLSLLETLGKFKEDAVNAGAQKIKAIAPPFFKNLKNSESVVKRVNHTISIPLVTLTDDTVSTLKYLSAEKIVGSTNIVVWDIDSDFVRFTYFENETTFKTFKTPLGSEIMKNMIITAFIGKDKSITTSPNPLGKVNAKKGLNFSQYYAETHVPSDVKAVIQNAKIIGVGNVHSNAILKNTDKQEMSYERQDVLKAISATNRMTDEDLKNSSKTVTTDMILVGGFMKGLNIQNVNVRDVYIAHSILTFKSFWE